MVDLDLLREQKEPRECESALCKYSPTAGKQSTPHHGHEKVKPTELELEAQ